MTADRAVELLRRLLVMTSDEIDDMIFSTYSDYCDAVDYAVRAILQRELRNDVT